VHELAVSQAIADAVVKHARGRPVRAVHARIGWFRQVVPDSLAFCWELLTTDTELDGARLLIEHVPAVIGCAECGASTTLDLPIMVCGACGASDVQLISGDEFEVDALEIMEVA